jgi:pSer/pThr/pTyr-binding forkhead associated (FHA) protein
MRSFGELRPVNAGEPIPLTRERVIIGSQGLVCDVVITGPDVLPLHCILVVRQGIWYVQQLSTEQGIMVNGVRVASEQRLNPGDILWIGTKRRYEVCYDPETLALLFGQ